MRQAQGSTVEPQSSVAAATDGRGPADAVRALFEAVVAREDHSEYATGELAELLRLEYEAVHWVESAARSLTVRRLHEVRTDGRTAAVATDVEIRAVWKDLSTDDWTPSARRLRGTAQVVKVGGAWRVVDLPTTRGRSVLRSHRLDRSASARTDALELDVRAEPGRAKDTYVLRMRNIGTRPLTPIRIVDERHALAVLPLSLRLPLTMKRTLAPGESWTFRYPWNLPFRLWSGSIGVEAVDDSGNAYSVVAQVPAPKWTPSVLAANTLSLRSSEAVAAALLIWGLLPGWFVASFLPGIALMVAASLRLVDLLSCVRYGSRGRGVTVLGVLAVAEAAVGSWLILRFDSSLDGVFILLSALALLVPSLLAFRKQT